MLLFKKRTHSIDRFSAENLNNTRRLSLVFMDLLAGWQGLTLLRAYYLHVCMPCMHVQARQQQIGPVTTNIPNETWQGLISSLSLVDRAGRKREKSSVRSFIDDIRTYTIDTDRRKEFESANLGREDDRDDEIKNVQENWSRRKHGLKRVSFHSSDFIAISSTWQDHSRISCSRLDQPASIGQKIRMLCLFVCCLVSLPSIMLSKHTF